MSIWEIITVVTEIINVLLLFNEVVNYYFIIWFAHNGSYKYKCIVPVIGMDLENTN